MFVVTNQGQSARPDNSCMIYDVILTAQACRVDENCDERTEYSGTHEMPDLPGNHGVTNIQLLGEL